MLPRAICGEWSLNLNSGLCFLGAPQKTQQPPWLLLAGSTAHFYSRHRTRVSLFRFPPSLPCLIALGIAFARCCIRRWPCVVCMYTLPGLPAGAPRLARVIPNWDKPKRPAGRCRVYCHLYTSYTNPEKHHRGHVGILFDTLRRKTQYPRDFAPAARPVRGARARAH